MDTAIVDLAGGVPDPALLRQQAEALRRQAERTHREHLLYLAMSYDRLACVAAVRALHLQEGKPSRPAPPPKPAPAPRPVTATKRPARRLPRWLRPLMRLVERPRRSLLPIA